MQWDRATIYSRLVLTVTVLPAVLAPARGAGPVSPHVSVEPSHYVLSFYQAPLRPTADGSVSARVADTGDVQRLRDCILVVTGWHRPDVGKRWALSEERLEERRTKYLMYLRGVEAQRCLYGMPRKQISQELHHLLGRLTPGTGPYADVAWVLASRGIYTRANVNRFLTVYTVRPHPRIDPWAREAWPIGWYSLAAEDVPGALAWLYQMSPHPRILEVLLNPREIFNNPRHQMDQLWYPWAHAVRKVTLEDPEVVVRLASTSDLRRSYLAMYWGYVGLMSGSVPPQADRKRARKVLRPYLGNSDPAIRATTRQVFYAMQRADRQVAVFEREFRERRRKAKAASG